MSVSEPDEPWEPRPVDRRRHRRVAVQSPIAAFGEGAHARMMASNISLEGLCCRSERRYRPSMSFDLTFEVSAGRGERAPEPLGVKAVVVRCDRAPDESGTWEVAFMLVHPDTRSRTRLAAYIDGKSAS